MTREKILAMKPGPEMDVLVAEKVMGGMSWGPFQPSSDISDTWKLVEKLQQKYLVSIYANPNNIPGELYTVHISKTAMGSNFVEIDSTTASEAICKAALLAVHIQ